MSKTETKPTLSQKVAELDATVEWFYSEDFTLDEALNKYKAAVKQAKTIEKNLAELKNQVEVVEDFTRS